MKNIMALIIFTSIFLDQGKIFPTPISMTPVDNLVEKKTMLSNEIQQLEESLQKLNKNKIKNYLTVGLSLVSSGVVYCLPFAPNHFEVNADTAFYYAIAVSLVNYFAKISFYNAFESRKKIDLQILDKRNQIEIINQFIQLVTEKNNSLVA